MVPILSGQASGGCSAAQDFALTSDVPELAWLLNSEVKELQRRPLGWQQFKS